MSSMIESPSGGDDKTSKPANSSTGGRGGAVLIAVFVVLVGLVVAFEAFKS